jgi:hypothetical protein
MNENANNYNDSIPEMEDYAGSEANKNEGQGERFGEFGNTGTGIDLTIELESNEVNPRSGLIKGGQRGEDALVGPAQYGGEAGDTPIKGNIDGNE